MWARALYIFCIQKLQRYFFLLQTKRNFSRLTIFTYFKCFYTIVGGILIIHVLAFATSFHRAFSIRGKLSTVIERVWKKWTRRLFALIVPGNMERNFLLCIRSFVILDTSTILLFRAVSREYSNIIFNKMIL